MRGKLVAIACWCHFRCARLLKTAITQTGQPPTYLPAQEGDTLAVGGADSISSGSSNSFYFPASWNEFWIWRGCPVGRWSDEEQRCYTSVLTWPATIVHGLRLLQVEREQCHSAADLMGHCRKGLVCSCCSSLLPHGSELMRVPVCIAVYTVTCLPQPALM